MKKIDFIEWLLTFSIILLALIGICILILGLNNIIEQVSIYKNKPQKYTVCFTPGDHCDDLVVKEIQTAHKDILIQAYHLSSHKIVAALLAKEAQSVPITVILDKTARKEAIPFLQANIPVYIDDKVRIAHNKVMVIDDVTTITGSFNFTDSAQSRNAENLLVIDNGQLASEYENNFYDRLNNSKEMR